MVFRPGVFTESIPMGIQELGKDLQDDFAYLQARANEPSGQVPALRASVRGMFYIRLEGPRTQRCLLPLHLPKKGKCDIFYLSKWLIPDLSILLPK